MCAAPTIRGSGFPTASNPARPAWLRALASWTRAHGTLLVADDIQMGCGRTGRLLSFETAGIIPDLICLSKSISGYGTPMALTLMRPEYDQWRPGEHNGTFPGLQPGLRHRRSSPGGAPVRRSPRRPHRGARRADGLRGPCGRGLAWGLSMDRPGAAREVCDAAFRAGLLLETAGPQEEVAKLLPPLTVAVDHLEQGLAILDEAVAVAGARALVA
ncbi:aminotransferase class III-fold pyridoxal phosphate-dependent enzyme [Streptomyces griseoluteus]|uniref:aminotransferase class III-fold pyridoxal phosphate-dependent enzyme n=1 Tax=Streptomyces griseoluteus TaxID=29306 RepID=UPI00380D7FC0